MDEATDEEVAARVQDGDIKSFDILIERYEKKLKRYAARFLFKDDADDIVQEVFIKAYINIKSFDAQKKFSSWIYRIAHNEFINAIKKKKTEKILFFDFDLLFPHPAAKDSADSEAINNSLRVMLEKCLDKIGAKYREPLVLYYFENLNYAEISEILHIPPSTVGVRLARGKAILKKKVNEIDPTYEQSK
ncbi:MAG TPA: RNA polymerase sigma factor [Candidatus Paceibacterota bacterium]|nr:RNA polymerase sigma factor [Candidatus Pacearchaeota archaeon]HRZ50432.1 RNA polymerase sigma factor [Candidatus Paceibacterota bacterium]HSA36153.1 RNA polymerase sigma factor [Candidatus Paceibacterota bacterium]